MVIYGRASMEFAAVAKREARKRAVKAWRMNGCFCPMKGPGLAGSCVACTNTTLQTDDHLCGCVCHDTSDEQSGEP